MCIAISSALFLCGCKKQDDAAAAPVTFTPIDMSRSGTITGTVHFEGKAPERPEIDMAQDPACQFGAKGPNLAEQYVVNDGALANVYVYIKSGLGDKHYAPPDTPVVLDQKGCQYVPHVIAAMVGQPIQIRNSDKTMHNVHPEPDVAANKGWDISQAPKGKPVTQTFNAPEIMLPIRCNNHPWMNAFANISDNPFHAVTDANGNFTIQGVPPGEYVVIAVHEKLGKKTANVIVKSPDTSVQDFTFKK